MFFVNSAAKKLDFH